MSEDCLSANYVKLYAFERPFDCEWVSPNLIVLTDLEKEKNRAHLVKLKNQTVTHTIEELHFPVGVCMLSNLLLMSHKSYIQHAHLM